MKILVAPDKFKGSLSATEACRAIIEGIHQCDSRIEAIPFPMADGGEGTCRILTVHARGEMRFHTVSDPLFRPVRASYGWSEGQKIAFIEMAAASGLHRVLDEERNPLYTTSLGTGELIRQAIADGAGQIVLGIGGSATNDGGIGMASALGYRFLDSDGREVKPTGENLHRIACIDDSELNTDLSKVTIKVACDVDNPLTGPSGASFTYGSQKGADPHEVELLEEGLRHLAIILRQHFGKDFELVPGAGAAGGLGAGALAFLQAELVPGTTLVMEQTGFAHQLPGLDLIITGEGKIDEQTLHGKLIKGLADEAKVWDIPVIALCGTLELSPHQIGELGLCFAGSILTRPCSLAAATQSAYANLRDLSFNLIQFYRIGRK
jgi:glycerate kinase